MRNDEVAEALHELADYSQVQGEEWEARAYRRVARLLEELDEDIEAVHAEGRLQALDGVGQAISEKIAQQLEEGRVEALEEVRASYPVDVPALLEVRGLGPKGVAKLHEALGITDLASLKQAAQEGQVSQVPGFGAKTQQTILEHIELLEAARGRHLLASALPVAKALVEALSDLPAIDRVALAGEARRWLPTVGRLELVATSSDPSAALASLDGLAAVEAILSTDEDEAHLALAGGLEARLSLVPQARWGIRLVQATGAPDHLAGLERRAEARGLSLAERGVIEADGRVLASEEEEAVYGALELTWVPPELREGHGEVDTAAADELPELIELADMRGDLQMHTTWSDGRTSVREMGEKAQALGYEYILITDHGPSLTVAGGPTEAELIEQREEIDQVNEALDLTVLQGVEANIRSDGIDVSAEACQDLDLVVASLHDPAEDATERVVHAIEAYPVDIFAHPTNRLIGRREGNDLDMEAIVEACRANDVAIEINAQPNRLDLAWTEVLAYRDEVAFVISTDAHAPAGMEHMGLGVRQARKGWLTADHVLNAQPLETLLSRLRG